MQSLQLKIKRTLLNKPLLDQLFFSGTSFAISTLTFFFLTKHDFGVLSNFLIFGTLATTISQALLTQSLQSRLLASLSKNNRDSFFFTLSILLQAIVLSVAVPMTLIYNKEYVFSSLYFTSIIYFDYCRRYFAFNADFNRMLALGVVASLAKLFSLIYLYIFKNIYDFIVLITLSNYLPCFISFNIRRIKLKNFNKNDFFQYLNYVKWLVVSALLQWFSGNQFLVSAIVLLKSEEVAIVRFVQNVFGVITMIFQAMESYIPQKIMKNEIASEVNYFLKNVVKDNIARILILSTVVSILIYLYQKEVMTISILVMQSLLVILVFIASIQRFKVRWLGRNVIIFNSYLFSFLFATISSKYMVETFGISGVFFGMLISQIIITIVMQVCIFRAK